MIENLTRVEYDTLLRQDFCHLRRALLLRSKPADRAGDELAYRNHRRQARRGAPG